MKWNNVADQPSMQDRDQFLGEWLILLGTDGSEVSTVLYDFEKKQFQIAGKIKEITHWMYPEEVFSPVQMMKLMKILKNPCCHKE